MIAAASLLDPTGDITPAMFPNDDPNGGVTNLTARLTAYINRAYALPVVTALLAASDQDAAATAYTYYLAYNAVASYLSAQPASASLQGLGSQSISGTQVKYFEERARLALAQFNTLTGATLVTLNPVSASVATSTSW